MIKELRKKIDAIDRNILTLLNDRMKLSAEIGKIKRAASSQIFVPVREKEIISNILKFNNNMIPNEALVEIYKEIMNASRLLQKKFKVAYFGPEATFTHLAAIKVFGRNVDYMSADSIKDVFCEVDKSRADYGVVPVENSTEGVINHTLDMFIDSDNKIVSEIFLEVSHCLLSKEKSLRTVRKIYSHLQPIAQTRMWIEKNLKSAQVVETVSTAVAARKAAAEKGTAAIASSFAGEMYGLNILARNIEDCRNNFTRFLVIGKHDSQPSGSDKTSIMFSVKDRIGVLHDALLPFKKYGINLTKIESRPTKKRAWEYIFFVDLKGHKDQKDVKSAIRQLSKSCMSLKILGSYPADKLGY